MNQNRLHNTIRNKISLHASNFALWLTAYLLKHGGCYNIPSGLTFNHSAIAHDLRVIQLNTLSSSDRLVFIMLTQWVCWDVQRYQICDIYASTGENTRAYAFVLFLMKKKIKVQNEAQQTVMKNCLTLRELIYIYIHIHTHTHTNQALHMIFVGNNTGYVSIM
jgi:hypothetical protein